MAGGCGCCRQREDQNTDDDDDMMWMGRKISIQCLLKDFMFISTIYVRVCLLDHFY